ncbi:hypothetical protein [Streptomyces griseicoloratus]|uniref:hypothetical protein n=1 Tax=Streptomyces griseicoloratus TaxID=2752516 RepID=UPI0028116EBE|nr:hypothetical protein [Streptomyces griseicoloratus]
MEQRIGSSSQPLEGAGFDPAFIPGLTTPASGEPRGAEPEKPEKAETKAGAGKPGDADSPDAERASETEEATEPEGTAASEKATEPEEAAAEEPEAGDPEAGDPDGPVFEAADRRARIVADHKGVRLALDDQECEFRWDEIGAVETETARFGKRFTVTVHTTDRRWYPIEVDAPARSRFKEWESALDEVLDAYFDDGEEDAGEPGEPRDAKEPEEPKEPKEAEESVKSKGGE